MVRKVIVKEEETLIGDDAVVAAEAENGLEPKVTRSVLELRPFLISGFAGIVVAALVAIGFVVGLHAAGMLTVAKATNGNDSTMVAPDAPIVDPSFPYPYDNSQQDYLDGYTNGFWEGYNRAQQEQQYPYPWINTYPYGYDDGIRYLNEDGSVSDGSTGMEDGVFINEDGSMTTTTPVPPTINQ